MAQSVATTTQTHVEIIAAYAATNQEVDAVEEAPAWVVVGAFYMPKTFSCKLELIGSVSLAGTEMIARLYNVTDAAVVSGSITPVIDGTTDERQLSGAFELLGAKLYQMQVQVINADITQWGIARSVALTNP